MLSKPNILHFSCRLLNISLMTMIAGCISTSGIESTSQPIHADTIGAGSIIAMSASMDWPTETWWSAYKDPQLESLISQTVSGSPTLRIAQIRVRLAQAFQDSRHADTLPNISTEGSFVREHFTERQFIPPPWAGHSDWNNQLTASLAYDLDLWGRQKSLWQASVSEVRATKIEVQQVRLELITTVVRTYIQLAMQYSLRDIAEAHLLQIKQRIAISKRSLFAGLGTEMEVTEAETPLPTLVAKIEAINSRIGLIQNQLAVLSGQGPEVGDTIKRPSMMLKVDIGLPDHLPANLIGRRPDILAYRWPEIFPNTCRPCGRSCVRDRSPWTIRNGGSPAAA